MSASLVGSEMCIRDSVSSGALAPRPLAGASGAAGRKRKREGLRAQRNDPHGRIASANARRRAWMIERAAEQRRLAEGPRAGEAARRGACASAAGRGAAGRGG
eukprot:6223649-Alexandrium_andersonii.AAC.1